MTEKCPTKLLDDLPADKDAFGGHQKVAETIANMIENEDGGKAIALIGSWGSGKSTVIKMLKNRLCPKVVDEKEWNKMVFVFDAWAHSGDVLRKTFLTLFSEEIKKWDQRELVKGYIKKEINKTTCTEQKVPTSAKIIGILFAICIPIAAIFRDSNLIQIFHKIIDFDQITFLGFHIDLDIFIVYFPVLVIVGIILLTCFLYGVKLLLNEEGKENTDNFIKQHLVFNIESISTSFTKEPDSYTFETVFAKSLNKLLKGNQKRIIIVIDNLDRMESSNWQEFWTTIQDFFDYMNREKTDWKNQFWLIAPFAQEAANKLWSTWKTNGIPDNDKLASEFIDKTFQTKFFVPSPILPDWKSYLSDALNEGFCQDDENEIDLAVELDAVCDIFYLYGVKKINETNWEVSSERYLPPSPRAIKLFVNQLTTSYCQWSDISLKFHAFYILKKEREPNVIVDIARGRYGVNEYKEVLGDRYWENIAVLHTNLPKERALHITIWKIIQEGLTKGEPELLKSVQNDREFHTVCKEVIQERSKNWKDNINPNFALSAYALDKIDDTDTSKWNEVWNILKDGNNHRKGAYKLNKKIAKGFLVLVKLQEGDEKKLFITDVLLNLPKWGITLEDNDMVVR